MNDRNKTELTLNITRLAALWLDGKGFKPVETEVGVERGWVADVAGVAFPTKTELIELRLVKRAPRWCYDGRDNGKYDAWKAARDAIPSRLTATIEVKTSVGDYRGDRKWTAEWPTSLCYVAMPEGMIPPEQWPKDWGVILFSQEGTTVRKVFPPARVATVSIEQHLYVVLNLAVARDHHTRYARLRELRKAARADAGERTTCARISTVISLVKAIHGGKPVEEALAYYGFRSLPDYARRELESIHPQ